MNIKNEKGSTIILFALVITVIIGFVGLAVDFGYAVLKDLQLTNAIDAATLAAAQDLIKDTTTATLTAEEYLQKNGIDPSTVTITFSDSNHAIRLESNTTVNNRFMRVLGINTTGIGASAKAIIGTTTGVSSGLKPFGIVLEYEVDDITGEFELDADGNKIPIAPELGTPITLETGDSTDENYGSGNFGLLAFNSDPLETTVLNGYDGPVAIGDEIQPKTGVVASISKSVNDLIDQETRSFDYFDFENNTYSIGESSRFFVVPIVDDFSSTQGTTQPVIVRGFAMFFVEEFTKGKEYAITGRFIRMVAPGEISTGGEGTDFGLSSIALVE